MADDLGLWKEWLKRAESNFVLGTAFSVDNLPKNLYLEDLCFELQQSAEKAVKTILLKYGIDFPKTHDIGELLKFLKLKTTVEIPENIIPVTKLTKYAVKTRYPNWNKISQEEYKEAVKLAQEMLNWVQSVTSED